jgi:hypothetical protein
VKVQVEFNAEELAIIEKRGLWNDVVLARDADALTDQDKHEKKGLARKLAQAAISGSDSLNFHLTIRKLRDGDNYWFTTPIQAKEYEAVVKQNLVELKEYILDNEKIEQDSDSFEL